MTLAFFLGSANGVSGPIHRPHIRSGQNRFSTNKYKCLLTVKAVALGYNIVWSGVSCLFVSVCATSPKMEGKDDACIISYLSWPDIKLSQEAKEHESVRGFTKRIFHLRFVYYKLKFGGLLFFFSKEGVRVHRITFLKNLRLQLEFCLSAWDLLTSILSLFKMCEIFRITFWI